MNDVFIEIIFFTDPGVFGVFLGVVALYILYLVAKFVWSLVVGG